MSDKVLSILIPVYNAQSYISRCIDSIVKQPGFNNDIEVVIINDGSTDSSLSILQQYQDKYSNIRVISRCNKGIGPTRNELIENASGRFFWFIDADDYISRESFETIIPLLTGDSYDMLLLSYNWETGDSIRLISYEGEFDSATDLTDKSIYNNSLWTRVYRTSIIKDNDIKMNSFIMGEDFDFIFKLTPLLGKVKCIETPLYNYVFNSNSAVGNVNLAHRTKVSEDSIKCILSNTEYLKSFPPEQRLALKKHLDYFTLGYLYSIYRVNFDYRYKMDVFMRLTKGGVFPIASDDGNVKHSLFVKAVNHKFIRIPSLWINCLVLKLHDSANMQKNKI